LKLGVARKYWFAGLDAEVERITEAALRKRQDAGVELVEAEAPDLASRSDTANDPADSGSRCPARAAEISPRLRDRYNA